MKNQINCRFRFGFSHKIPVNFFGMDKKLKINEREFLWSIKCVSLCLLNKFIYFSHRWNQLRYQGLMRTIWELVNMWHFYKFLFHENDQIVFLGCCGFNPLICIYMRFIYLRCSFMELCHNRELFLHFYGNQN